MNRTELELIKANALTTVKFCDNELKKLDKPEKKVSKRVLNAIARADRNIIKRYSKQA